LEKVASYSCVNPEVHKTINMKETATDTNNFMKILLAVEGLFMGYLNTRRLKPAATHSPPHQGWT
jgi:hypothetical protein